MRSAPIFRPGLSGLGRLAALGSRLAAGALAHARLWGIGTCCRRSWGLTAASLGPLGPHVALWRWSCQRGRSIRISLRLPLVAAVCLPGCRRAGGWVSCQNHTPFTVRRGPAFTPLSPTPESALMLLVFALVFRIRRTVASSYARKPFAGRAGLEPAGGLSAAPHDGRGSPPPVRTVRFSRTVQLVSFPCRFRRAVAAARFVVPRARPAGRVVQPEHVAALSFA